MWNPIGKSVKCKSCGREYFCLPSADYYNSTGPTDGVCEACLLRGAGLTEADVIDLTGYNEGSFSRN